MSRMKEIKAERLSLQREQRRLTRYRDNHCKKIREIVNGTVSLSVKCGTPQENLLCYRERITA